MEKRSDYNKEEEDPTTSTTMWGMETGAATDCDCPGPPPEFMLPPPPRPPFLQPQDPLHCTEDPLPIETCDALPLIDASYRSSPSFQTSAVIVLCSVLLVLVIFIIVILVWKHKRKVQNFLPCKTSPQNNCDGPNTASVIYDDLQDVMPRPTATTATTHHHHHHTPGGHIVAPCIEMIDVKNNIHFPSGYPMSQHPPVFLCSSPGPDPYCSQDLYNPVYEELSDADSEMGAVSPLSEDEFAEDELSLGGDNERLAKRPNDSSAYRTTDSLLMRNHKDNHHHHLLHHNQQQQLQQRYRRPQEPLPPLPNNTINNNKRHHHNHHHHNNNRSLDRRGGQQQQQQQQQQHEFHEGVLLDALLQLYPRVGSIGGGGGGGTQNRRNPNHHHHQAIPSITQRLQCMSPSTPPGPYDSVPVIGHLATFRPMPKPYSNDSAFGSDSGYSNHTSGTRGSLRGGRRDPRRLSQLSAELALT